MRQGRPALLPDVAMLLVYFSFGLFKFLRTVLCDRGGLRSSLMFCTNGVLLRMLCQGDELDDVTHVVVDEIHERDRCAGSSR